MSDRSLVLPLMVAIRGLFGLGRRDVQGRRRARVPGRLGLMWRTFLRLAVFGGGASRSREAAGEGRRKHQRGTGQISAKTGESVVTRPRRRTRRLQCDVSGATLTEIEGPGTSSGAYGRGGGGGLGEGGREGPGVGREERRSVLL